MRAIKSLGAFFIFTTSVVIAGFLFWEQEMKYALPTPVPDGYQIVYTNEKVEIGDTLSKKLPRPVFYHFFSTDCPCSKFNLDHFNRLKKQYAEFADFYVVIPEGSNLEEARDYFRGEVRLIEDRNREYAIRCGVYSTPQAVIITPDRKLYYRGNYNKARYCVDPMSNFAQMAMDSLIMGVSPPNFGPLSVIAYGCGLDEKNTLNQLFIWNN